MPHLIVKNATHGYQIFRFTSDIRIGRHPGSDIVLDSNQDNTISRCHAAIQQERDGFWLKDSSLNGTWVNDIVIETHRLRDGDRFQIANYTFTFIEDAAVRPIATTADAATDGIDLRETEEIVRCNIVLHEMTDQALTSQLKSMDIIAVDQQMLALFHDIHAISQINAPVLILGEPGTGKEKIAQALHTFSQATGEFVAVNCSAIPEGLFESELFGSVKGAFSDAAAKPGKLELAENGTLFLDEVGDMSRSCQPKLLRFLESRAVSRLGETKVRHLNLRIVAATNQDLKQMVASRTFRPDLFQRLACVRLNVPPLRERKQDIAHLADYFLARYARQYNFSPLKISARASDLMRTYYWPGNVRELANIMLNVCIRLRGGTIMPTHLIAASEEIGTAASPDTEGFLSLHDMEKHHIQKALDETGNNKSKASTLLGISRDTLYKKIHKYRLR